MKIKVKLKNIDPAFFEDIIPIMSDELIEQINKRKKQFLLTESEYKELLTELTALENHLEEYSPDYQLQIERAVDDFTSGWSYVLEY